MLYSIINYISAYLLLYFIIFFLLIIKSVNYIFNDLYDGGIFKCHKKKNVFHLTNRSTVIEHSSSRYFSLSCSESFIF